VDIVNLKLYLIKMLCIQTSVPCWCREIQFWGLMYTCIRTMYMRCVVQNILGMDQDQVHFAMQSLMLMGTLLLNHFLVVFPLFLIFYCYVHLVLLFMSLLFFVCLHSVLSVAHLILY
jgi:hypothetical protein